MSYIPSTCAAALSASFAMARRICSGSTSVACRVIASSMAISQIVLNLEVTGSDPSPGGFSVGD